MTSIQRLQKTFAGAVAATTVGLMLITTGCSLPTSGAEATPTGAPPASSGLTLADALAVVSLNALLSQVPDGDKPKDVAKFRDTLNKQIKNPSDKVADLGVARVSLTDSLVTDKGANGTVCFEVTPDTVDKIAPSQTTWAVYTVPGESVEDTKIFMGPGIEDCQQGKEAAEAVSADPALAAQKAGETLRLTIDAYNAIPVSALTPAGLRQYDQLRVWVQEQSNPSAQTPATP